VTGLHGKNLIRAVAVVLAVFCFLSEQAYAAAGDNSVTAEKCNDILIDLAEAYNNYGSTSAVNTLFIALDMISSAVKAADNFIRGEQEQKDGLIPGSDTAVSRGSNSDESQWYSSKIPMKKEHQKLLWDYCQLRKLDYIDMLALISLESNFNEKCSNGKYKGYFQISTNHAKNLAKTLRTENNPLDGEININWGTAFYSWILEDERVKGLEGKQKRDVALSIYNRGSGGYDKYGLATGFLKEFYKKREIIESYFKNNN